MPWFRGESTRLAFSANGSSQSGAFFKFTVADYFPLFLIALFICVTVFVLFCCLFVHFCLFLFLSYLF